MPRFEFHLHEDSLMARTVLLPTGVRPMRVHEGFSQADIKAGWQQVRAETLDQAETGSKEQEIVAFCRSYWERLEQEQRELRVVVDGEHFVRHPLETGAGFGGKAFRIVWIDKDRESVVCNLSAQGRVPQWIRDKIPDNATSVLEVK